MTDRGTWALRMEEDGAFLVAETRPGGSMDFGRYWRLEEALGEVTAAPRREGK
ncbi:MAG: hypothetical protein WEG36_12300 [Gemmatimonadota bacterium]